MKRLLAVAVFCLLLAGCYESQQLLLDQSAWRQPLATGEYFFDGDTASNRLTVRADGWYDNEQTVDGDIVRHVVLLNELDIVEGRQIYAWAARQDNGQAFYYGLAAVSADGSRHDSMSASCTTDAAKAVAVQWGASESGGTCTFHGSDSVLGALRAIAHSPDYVSRLIAKGL